jgi:uncharacterized protein YsxB (DUF464 family)
MIRVSFRFPSPDSARFKITGHAGYADAGEDVVCAAVSSAAYLTANTITEILGVKADATVKEGFLEFSFGGSEAAVKLVEGLRLHTEQLQAEHPKHVKVTTEV